MTTREASQATLASRYVGTQTLRRYADTTRAGPVARRSANYVWLSSACFSRPLRLRTTARSRHRVPDREVSKWEPGSPAFAAATAEPGPFIPAGPYRHDERVLLGRHSRVWSALRMHLCLLQESTSSQNLAALREEGRLGRVLQSCCDWDPAACCCCNCLHCNGLLRPVYQMNSKVSHSSTANQGDKDEVLVGNLDQV